ncbi:MAG: DUF2185 domain-containing protein [Proteobacteria bacterium]|nr:DUF2185 domain-containing protein [Pseudomonadota bacterium]
MTKKAFRLQGHEMRPLVGAMGGCLATDHIAVDGLPVRFMYREASDHESDSGWRFFSGFEDEAYANNPAHMEVYEVSTIANYDPGILPFLDAPPGSAFEKAASSERFEMLVDWKPDAN